MHHFSDNYKLLTSYPNNCHLLEHFCVSIEQSKVSNKFAIFAIHKHLIPLLKGI